MTAQEKKLFPCFVCKNNGFPSEMVVLAGRDDRGAPIRLDPDENPHTHKTKLAGGGKKQWQQQIETIPMTQPLSSSSNNNFKSTKDEEIARMHTENQLDRKAYRDVLRDDVEAKRELAKAINELAKAIRSRGGGRTLDEEGDLA